MGKILKGDKLNFEKLSADDGLSQGQVVCIIQDHMGFMWFGTVGGLNRYDGNKFKVYEKDPDDPDSICSSFIHCLFEDSKKRLWIGTSEGLSRYDNEKDNFVNYNTDGEVLSSIPKGIVCSVCEGNFGDLWIGTLDGVYKYNEAENHISHYLSDIHGIKDFSRIVYKDRKNNIWSGTSVGLYLFDRSSQSFFRIELSDKLSEKGKNQIWTICEDNKGNLYIGTSSGMFLKKENENNFKHFSPDPQNPCSISDKIIRSIFADSSDNILIGTWGRGLDLFYPETDEFSNYRYDKDNPLSMSLGIIASIYEDKSGVIWIGSYVNGLNKFRKDYKKIQLFCCKGNTYVGMLEDKKGYLWIAAFEAGIVKLDRKQNLITQCNPDYVNPDTINSHLYVTCIAEEDKDFLWIGTFGTYNGLNKYEKKTKKLKRIYIDDKNKSEIGYIGKIVKGAEDVLWLGTNRIGLAKFDIEKENFTFYKKDPYNIYSISSNNVSYIYRENDEILWVGTYSSGLDKFDLKEGKFYNYKNDPGDPASISGNKILSIQTDQKGNMWIGTYDGLNKFDREKNNFKRFNKHNGLPDNNIMGILEDDEGYLWISTMYGLSKFDTEKEIFKNFDIRDGFQGNDFTLGGCLKLQSGELAFGGTNGLNIFYPRNITENSYIPPVVITDFQIFNKSVSISETDSVLNRSITLENEITLSYKDSVFSFEFAALDYNIPSKNQYAYMMEGFDREWVYCGSRRFVTYTNLDPGEYVFRVKGSNNDGIWNEEGASLKITITPPFWKTWWFKSLGALSIATATGLTYRQKLAKVEKSKELQEEFSKRLLESQEDERKKIASNLHDTIAHDILIAKNKAVIGMKNTDDPSELKSILNEISEMSSETLKDVRSISYNLHPHQIERLGMTKAVRSIINRISNSSDIKFTCNIDNIDSILSKELEINVFRIIQECFNNILKHSGASEASLKITKDNRILKITVWDNGKGISKNKIEGLGLSGIAERVKLYKGELLIESDLNKETSILIRLPYKFEK